MVFSLNTASDIFIKLALHSFQWCAKRAGLLEKVAFSSGKIIFESIVILAQCKLYTHINTYIYVYMYY